MGNSVFHGPKNAGENRVAIHKFYTQNAWIEGRAEDQLTAVGKWQGVQKIAAFPDLHPGKYGPIGCAVLADRIYPQLIGNDIGCGMSLFQLDLPKRKFKLEKAMRRMRELGEVSHQNYADRLAENALPADMFADSLGTIGGGNHFCEVQTLVRCDDQTALDKTCLYLLVHSGSRGLGNEILTSLPAGAFDGLNPQSDVATHYISQHDMAVKWASLNRQIIAERAADALRADLICLTNAPHNLLTNEFSGWLHRKGAAQANIGLVPLAGSRATPSYLLQANVDLHDALGSTAHGAGRRYDRSSMHGRVKAQKTDILKMQRTPYGGRVICEDKDLMVEESPFAYKSSQNVVDDLKTLGVAQAVATFHPLITFKKTRKGER